MFAECYNILKKKGFRIKGKWKIVVTLGDGNCTKGPETGIPSIEVGREERGTKNWEIFVREWMN